VCLDAEYHCRFGPRRGAYRGRVVLRGIYTTALEPDELIMQIEFPSLGPDWRFAKNLKYDNRELMT
jgi:CO/xanthine dehydrogenase FAD-binding subunit